MFNIDKQQGCDNSLCYTVFLLENTHYLYIDCDFAENFIFLRTFFNVLFYLFSYSQVFKQTSELISIKTLTQKGIILPSNIILYVNYNNKINYNKVNYNKKLIISRLETANRNRESFI